MRLFLCLQTELFLHGISNLLGPVVNFYFDGVLVLDERCPLVGGPLMRQIPSSVLPFIIGGLVVTLRDVVTLILCE
jgi:hypothetical protein